ncbi:DUF1761 domain-containing protein [Allonocardiopsis opalescens]|uniref:Uncharacterized protein DUF1761 n=1 Tax=Allonocardiopsis opalescens TaxID=1144618 RepID=A0A2T0QF49_9ACTN|nr:DUF1761 domain-containing protein [Allonocardiopsis opalescens]PRY02473.1 uncharacterized protein DUF1761 [Allonocardiopsis opalescens]
MEIEFQAVAVAAAAAFLFAVAYHTAVSRRLAPPPGAEAGAAPRPWKILAFEPVRILVVACVVAGLSAGLGIADAAGALGLALAVWAGFPLVLLSGSVVWSGLPWRHAAVQAGNWLGRLLVIAVIVGLWP